MANIFNYAAPGSRVGIQAENIVITGGIVFTDDDVQVGGVSLTDLDDEDEG
jgi:hypothetical protein